MPSHARTETSAPAARRRRSRAHRRGPRRARTALALGSTLVAAAVGGVFAGVLPPPPGVPSRIAVAGDPAGASATATVRGTHGASPTGAHRGTHAPAPGLAPPTSAAPRQTGSAGASPSGTGAGAASGTPSAAASGPASVSASASMAGAEQAADAQVLALVNQQRAAHGCGALTASPALSTLATAFSQEMALEHFFNHTDPAGHTPWDRAAAAGITDLGGENIARGQQTPGDVMSAWMKSPGHRANILDCSYHYLGVGVYFGTGGPWWTEDFGY